MQLANSTRAALCVDIGILTGGKAIMEETGIKLEGVRLDRNSVANPFYERGTGYLYRFYVPGNVDKAITALGSAIKTDPAFTEAYAALAKLIWKNISTPRTGSSWMTLAIPGVAVAASVA